jgi:flavin-dependent dehydrogenase
MAVQNYHLLIIGGGIAGASLAGAVAKQGARVLVSESENRFRDRVRGGAIMP